MLLRLYDEALEIVIKEINLKHKVAEVLKSKTWSTAFVAYSNILCLSFAHTHIHRSRDQGTKSKETHFISVKNKKLLQKRPKRIENAKH